MPALTFTSVKFYIFKPMLPKFLPSPKIDLATIKYDFHMFT